MKHSRLGTKAHCPQVGGATRGRPLLRQSTYTGAALLVLAACVPDAKLSERQADAGIAGIAEMGGDGGTCQPTNGTGCAKPDETASQPMCKPGTANCRCIEGTRRCADDARESQCRDGEFSAPMACPADASCRGDRCRALEWTLQLGTPVGDNALALSVDEDGNVVVAGFSANGVNGDNQSFVRKYNPLGAEPSLWERQFGTSSDDSALAVTVDGDGNVIVAGYVSDAFEGQVGAGENDAYIRKYDRGGQVLWTRQFGTPGDDAARAVRADAAGNVIATGYVEGALPGQTSSGDRDAFVIMYDANGSETPVWTRQFGSAESDEAASLALDASGNIFVAGNTDGALMPETNVGSQDAFVRSYSSSGVARWLRQFGTPQADGATGVAVDATGDVFVVGNVSGTFPGESSAGLTDAFVRKYGANGGEPLWTRQFGTPGSDGGTDGAPSVAIDGVGNIIVSGTAALAEALPNQISRGERDIFVRAYDAAGSEPPLWTRQLGSSGRDTARAVAVDRIDSVLVCGGTNGVLGEARLGVGGDAVLLKLAQP